MLQESSLSLLRLAIKALLVLGVLLGVFFLPFIQRLAWLLPSFSSFVLTTVTVNNLSEQILTSTNSFSQPLSSISELQSLYSCLNASNLFTQVWQTLPFLGLALLCVICVGKVCALAFDWVKALYERERWSCNSIMLFAGFHWCACQTLFAFYYVFLPWFRMQASPCVSSIPASQSQQLLTNQSTYFGLFIIPHALIFALFLLGVLLLLLRNLISQVALAVCSSIMIGCSLAYLLVVRLGLLSSFAPCWIRPTLMLSLLQTYDAWFGLFPELLLCGQFLLMLVVDLIFLVLEPSVKIAEDRYYLHPVDFTDPKDLPVLPIDHDHSHLHL